MRKANKWLIRGHNWLLPRCCLLCSGDAADLDLCRRCVAVFPRIARACAGCGAPLSAGRLCAGCLRRPRFLGRVCVPYRYEPPLSSLILRLKFRHGVEIAAPLGQLLLEHVRAAGTARPDAILPVPLHPKRLRARGFNQALEIARPLAEGVGVPLVTRLAARRRHTAAQSLLGDAAGRRRNVRGAFAVDNDGGVAFRHVVIVDDVVTTGATAIELARTLKRAGVDRVDLWSVARAAAP